MFSRALVYRVEANISSNLVFRALPSLSGLQWVGAGEGLKEGEAGGREKERKEEGWR